MFTFTSDEEYVLGVNPEGEIIRNGACMDNSVDVREVAARHLTGSQMSQWEDGSEYLEQLINSKAQAELNAKLLDTLHPYEYRVVNRIQLLQALFDDGRWRIYGGLTGKENDPESWETRINLVTEFREYCDDGRTSDGLPCETFWTRLDLLASNLNMETSVMCEETSPWAGRLVRQVELIREIQDESFDEVSRLIETLNPHLQHYWDSCGVSVA